MPPLPVPCAPGPRGVPAFKALYEHSSLAQQPWAPPGLGPPLSHRLQFTDKTRFPIERGATAKITVSEERRREASAAPRPERGHGPTLAPASLPHPPAFLPRECPQWTNHRPPGKGRSGRRASCLSHPGNGQAWVRTPGLPLTCRDLGMASSVTGSRRHRGARHSAAGCVCHAGTEAHTRRALTGW